MGTPTLSPDHFSPQEEASTGCCWLPGPSTNKSQAHPSTSNTLTTSKSKSGSPTDSPCSIVTLSEVPAVCWAPRLLPAPFRSLDACRLGTNDPCCDRKVAKLIGPPNTSPCGNISRNLEDGSIGP